MLVFPLVEGRDADWSPWTYTLMASSAAPLTAFVLYEPGISRRGQLPLVQLRMSAATASSRGHGFISLLVLLLSERRRI